MESNTSLKSIKGIELVHKISEKYKIAMTITNKEEFDNRLHYI